MTGAGHPVLLVSAGPAAFCNWADLARSRQATSCSTTCTSTCLYNQIVLFAKCLIPAECIHPSIHPASNPATYIGLQLNPFRPSQFKHWGYRSNKKQAVTGLLRARVCATDQW